AQKALDVSGLRETDQDVKENCWLVTSRMGPGQPVLAYLPKPILMKEYPKTFGSLGLVLWELPIRTQPCDDLQSFRHIRGCSFPTSLCTASSMTALSVSLLIDICSPHVLQKAALCLSQHLPTGLVPELPSPG
ncbi:hypothetical protein P7K49_008950, partial [Saguinus oedipus]